MSGAPAARRLLPAAPSRGCDVNLYRHETDSSEDGKGWTLARLLAALRRYRPRSPGGANRTFVVGGGTEYLAISTNGAYYFSGQHPLWGEADKFEGAMIFDNLTLTDVESILTKFYEGRRAEGCFAPYYGRFEFYRPGTPKGG